jgi:hypothetical protein
LLDKERDDRLHRHGDQADDEDRPEHRQHGGGEEKGTGGPKSPPAALPIVRHSVPRDTCEPLAGQERDGDAAAKEHGSGQHEGGARANAIIGNAAEEGTGRGTGEDGRLHHAEGITETRLWGAGGDERGRRGHSAGQYPFQHAQPQQLPGCVGETHHHDNARATEESSQQHRLAAIAIGKQSPDGCGDGHGRGTGGVDGTRPECLCGDVADAEIAKIEREERYPRRKPDQGQQLPHPDGVEGDIPAGLSRVEILEPVLATGVGCHGCRV